MCCNIVVVNVSVVGTYGDAEKADGVHVQGHSDDVQAHG